MTTGKPEAMRETAWDHQTTGEVFGLVQEAMWAARKYIRETEAAGMSTTPEDRHQLEMLTKVCTDLEHLLSHPGPIRVDL